MVKKGEHCSDEHKMKIGLANKGNKCSEENKKLLSNKFSGKNHPMYGIHRSEETKEKISIKNKGKLAWNKGIPQTKEVKEKLRLANIGKKHTEEQKLKVSLKLKGSKAYWFGKNISEEAKTKIRNFRKNQILPVRDTSIEVKIQGFLKQLGIDFFTHQYIKEIEHGYQCDILIPSMNMVIECDGNYWHKYPIGKEIDHVRTKELIEKGFKVLRLWEFEIRKMDIDNFKIKLSEVNKR